VWQLPTFVFAPAILGTVAYSDGLRMLVAAVVNLHHFVLDGAVWKLRDGRVASILLRSGASTGPDLGVAPHRPWLRPTVWAVGAVCFAIAFVSIWEREFGVRRAHANGDIERMRSAVSRLIAIGQDESAIHRNLGILAAREKQPQLALEELEKSLLLAEHPRAWFEIGHLYAGSRDWQRTVSAYEAAYAIDAKPEMLIGRLAGALMRLGDPDRAREVLLEGLLVHPGHSVLAQQLDNVEQRLRDRASDGDGNAGEGASVPGL
jgi:tetratricopeptide (TPR) repeat protein